MSFGSGGGFSFGSNTNTQSTGFGGFGSNNTNTNTGFGSNTSNPGFGSSTVASNPFGGSSSTFGSNQGGFGNNANTSGSLFGNKPAANPFGSSATNTGGGGLFGSSTNTNAGAGFGSTGGGFGNTNNAFGGNTNTGSTFSFGNTSKPAFGSSTNSTPLFGQGGSGTTGGFGSSNAFGTAGSGTALSNQPVPPSEGTASTPFAPTMEKDGTGNAASNYQSINFMQPYQKYSFEELRLADYNAGRQYGNATGQAGGFGSSTFGGFGSSNTGFAGNTNNSPFGSQTTSSSGFGTQSSTTGFGSGGLFGNKPASGGLFGQQSSAAPSGGLFGTSNQASTSAFGGGSSGFGSGSGGLFGNNQNQNKPNPFGGNTSTPSFSFGNTNTSNANTGGGLFGNTNASSNAFGGGQQQPQQQQQQSGGLFGNNNQQQKPSLFGNTGGGFGTSTTQNQTSGGLFGNTNAGNTSGGLFGQNNPQQNAGGGLFGSNTNTGNSLFGNQNVNQTAKPGGLFGGSSFGNTNTGNTGGGLFGNTSTNNQQSGGLFGNANNNTGSGFSFGNTANKPATGGLFSSTNTNQGGLGGSTGFSGSLFGPSQNNQQGSQQQPDFKVSSLNDPNPYGQTSIWTGLPVPTPENAKPIFTPLSATQKMKESQSKPPPSLRLNQSRYGTPPRRPGFGFTYSTYGTPNSAASTPGGGSLSSTMYGSRSFNGGSFGRSFAKSASATNLRSQFAAESDGVLSPNAFASSNTRWSSGNMRRLTIDRSIRSDLFSRPSLPAFPTNALEKPINGTTEAIINGEPSSSEPINKLKKRVSFDKDATGGEFRTLNGESGALVRTETDDDELDAGSGTRVVSGSATPEAESVRGNELAVVPEDRESDDVISRKATVQAKPDPQPGDYWMSPTRAELSKLPRDRLTRFVGFQVGRKGCGRVEFNGPVDLTALALDDLYEKIVEIRLRSVTVYPDPSTKPPVGKGLNVPSTISIENSWPRSRGQPSSATSGPIFDKHVNRLQKMHGTEFVNYEVTTGVWTFRVPHYTRYGLDYDDDVDELGQSQFSAPPDSLSGSRSGGASAMEVDSEDQDDYEDDGDDTFAFKQKMVPGGYGRRSAIDYDADVPTAQSIEDGTTGLELAEASDNEASDNEVSDNEVSMVGSFPPPGGAPTLDMHSPNQPILKASRIGTPGKTLINIDGDWAEQLQRTISPRKQNRDALRDVQSKVLLDRAYEPMKPRSTLSHKNKNEFRTSIDIMNSLFSRHEERMAGSKGKKKVQAGPDFEFPYTKRAKTFEEQFGDEDDEMKLSGHDKAWHAAFKPHFTSTGKLVYKANGGRVSNEDGWTTEMLVEEFRGMRDLVVTSLQGGKVDNVAMDLKSLLTETQVTVVDEVPFISHVAVPFSQTKDQLTQQRGTTIEELDIYELLHVLFDTFSDEFTHGLSKQQVQDYQSQIRKDRLSKFLSTLTHRRHGSRIQTASKANAATAAVLHLTVKNVHAACDALMTEKDFHLSLLVAQIETADSAFQDDIAIQIEAWRSQGIISEISNDIRALYEILAGNTTVAQGKSNVAVEDRASTFAISEKYELDWVQAFSLCLWYGKHKDGEIGDVVSDFQEKVSTGVESASPVEENGDEDPLWVVLKLFASSNTKVKGNKAGARVVKPVLPQSLSALSRPWDCSQVFRLYHAIVATLPETSIDHATADDVAMALAFEHSTRGNIAAAIYALLHLRDAEKRKHEIRDLLTKHAANLASPPEPNQPPTPLWTALTTSLHIPAPWIWSAQALHARSFNKPLAELRYLVHATDFASAHECLIRRVAPRLVIDEDWETLHRVLAGFGTDAQEKVDGAIAVASAGGTEWKDGGGVYADFVDLVALIDSSSASGAVRRASSGSGGNAASDVDRKKALLTRLRTALTALNSQYKTAGGVVADIGKDREKLEERVALCEMGKAVAMALEREEEMHATKGTGVGGDQKSILDLPLTADARLTHTRALGVEYYRGLMAMAR